MLKRVRIKGYKSLIDVEVKLTPLAVLFGPNASGKSNFLDALQLLSKVATSKTLKDAFEPPYRGKPLESFSFGESGIKGLVEQERLTFSIEADLKLSDAVVDAVNRQVREMRRPSGEITHEDSSKGPAQVREQNLRYRIEIEMLPKSGILRVADEYLAALNTIQRANQPESACLSSKGVVRRFICASKDRPTRLILIATLTTASYRCRTTRLTIHILWQREGSWRTGFSFTSNRASGCAQPVRLKKFATSD